MFQILPLAALPDDIAPIFAMVLVFGIPIIAILTSHQRKMTELMRNQNPQFQPDTNLQHKLDSLQSQVSELKSLMQQHIINSDPPQIQQSVPPPTPSIEQRLNN